MNPVSSKAPGSWLKGNDIDLVLAANKAGRKSVTLTCGVFDVKYPAVNKVMLTPQRGYVPCGTFDIKKLNQHEQFN